MNQTLAPSRRAIVIGGGPAGLMAAEVLAAGGVQVDLYDAMPSVGRKFLLAGKGGMNITHSEPTRPSRRATAAAQGSRAWLAGFTPEQVRAWIHALGIDTFVGTSGRVFPTDMKAAPLLRAWLHRLREAGVRFHMRHRWLGWRDGALLFATPDGERLERPAPSCWRWAAPAGRGSARTAPGPAAGAAGRGGRAAGAGQLRLRRRLERAFRSRHAGAPLTTVALALDDVDGRRLARKGQFVVTAGGIEGSLVYALSAPIRDLIARDGQATVWLDLLPDHDAARVLAEVTRRAARARCRATCRAGWASRA
jgi:uncharacterized flavoprotein (TIGR03862 family)